MLRLAIVVIAFALPITAHTAEVSFSRDVRPILSNRCFKCHGPDLKKGGLDLQNRDSALATLKTGAKALVPGKSGDSEMFHRVSAPDADGRMPPKGEPLTAAQIAILK